MSEPLVVVNRWKRYGKDRLYVQRPDGSKHGYWDLLTDTGYPETPADLTVLAEALAGWRAGQPASTQAPASAGDPRAGERVSLPVRWVHPDELLGTPTPRKKNALRRAASIAFNSEERAGLHDDEGEDKVAAQLQHAARKDPRWLFAHTSQFTATDHCFDHVLVGPGGVFLIGTRRIPHRTLWVRGDTFMVDGTRFPYITDLRQATQYAAQQVVSACGFAVPVTGLLLVVDSPDLTVQDLPDDIEVMSRMMVAEWLLKRSTTVGDGEQIAAFDVLTNPALWRTA